MQSNRTLVIASIILSCGIFFTGLKFAHAIKNFHNFDKYVEVKGLDEKIVKSTQASWQISFSVSADDLEKTYQKVSEAQKTIAQFLLNSGFQPSEIERLPITVMDNRSDPYIAQNNPNITRYKATAGASIVTNKVDLVAQTSQNTNTLIQEGIIVTSNTVRYAYTELNSIKNEMLDTATQNAREAAKSFAKIAKTNLGTIRRAQQGLFTISSAGAMSEYDESSIMKKIRVVTSVQFFLD